MGSTPSSYCILIFICGLCENVMPIFLDAGHCPANCICYADALSNLASWEWIESDVHSNPDDPGDQTFNPYTEHNEVYENSKRFNQFRTKEVFQTVTCILRNDSPLTLSDTFNEIPPSTQVLSILQGAGSGNITIGRRHFKKLTKLIGIDIQGYKDVESEFSHRPSSFRLEADSLLSLRQLTYLSLDNVLLQQRSVATPTQEFTSKIVTVRKIGAHFNRTHNDEGNEVLTELESQLIFLSPKTSKLKEPIVPYSVYKSASNRNGKMYNGQRAKDPEPKVAVAFTGIPSLLHLRISECNMQDISWDMFHRLQSLKFLLIERNDLLFLPDFVFYATSNLTTLSLSGNRILSLQTVGLAGLLYLQKLDVTHNNITHLSELSLPPFPHLEVADFRHNPIEAIFPNTFEVMNTTKSLYLGNPLISLQIFPNSFFGLTNLLNLQITNIRIDFLERPMFTGLPNLRALIMDGRIKRISYDAFSDVPALEKLILRKCKIEKISMDAFFGLTSLIELDLSYNKFTILPPGVFDDQVSLREIHLQHNQLTTIPQNLFLKTPSKMIRLEGNQWHCSCDMVTWNPSKINQVKSYYIPKNDPSCLRQYDKGSNCYQEQKVFQVKYIYEKRVSPVCETPQKFYQRNVFDVLRKELRYCAGSDSVKSINKTVKSTKTFHQLLKEQEKALFFSNQEKVKKLSKETLTTFEKFRSEASLVATTEVSDVQFQTMLTLELPTQEPSNEQPPFIDRPIVDIEKNAINHIKDMQQLARAGVPDLKIVDMTTMRNDISQIPLTNYLVPTTSAINFQSKTLKPPNSKLSTPKSFKSIKKYIVPPFRSKAISKKALKLAKLYATQTEETKQSN